MRLKPVDDDVRKQYAPQLSKLLTKVLLHHEWFTPSVMKLVIILTDGIPTAATDGRYVYLNPKFFFGMPEGAQLYVLLHECLHCMLLHMLRIGGRDKQVYNIAADAIINALLDEYALACRSRSPIQRPPGDMHGVDLPKYKDWDVIAAYNDLLRDAEKRKGSGQGKGGTPFDEVLPASADEGEGEEEGEGGSGAEQLEAEWSDVLINATQMAKAMGRLPGVFGALVEEMVRPQLPWVRLFYNYFKDRFPIETSWTKVNRRFVGQGTYLPGLDGERLNKVIFGVDVSGSISDREIAVAVGGVNEVMEDVRPEELWMVQWDTRVQEATRYTPDDFPLQTVEVKGRGGTDINDFFSWVEENHPECEFVVVLTDGCLSFPPPPRFNVIWLLTAPASPGYGVALDVRA